MNIGLIIAGGVGQRMKMNVPKQFIKVLGKPIMIYTLEAFERNENIDEVVVVCLKGWEEKLQKWCEQYGIKKLKHIVPGGNTGMESLRNGMKALRDNYPEDSIIVIHDAVRPRPGGGARVPRPARRRARRGASARRPLAAGGRTPGRVRPRRAFRRSGGRTEPLNNDIIPRISTTRTRKT